MIYQIDPILHKYKMIEWDDIMVIDFHMSPIKRDTLHNDFTKLMPWIWHIALVKPYLIWDELNSTYFKFLHLFLLTGSRISSNLSPLVWKPYGLGYTLICEEYFFPMDNTFTFIPFSKNHIC